MTRIRKLALKISNQVVKWASPGCKEWAEGLAREVAFIESDWAALRWSLGSVRIVFDRREMPIGSLDEAAAQFKKFVRPFDFVYVTVGLWTSFLIGPESMVLDFCARSATEHFDNILLASFCGIILWQNEKHRLKQQMTDDVPEDVVTWALTYKAALRRHCWSMWIPAFANASWVIGIMLERGGFRAFPILNSINILWIVGVV